MSDQQNTTTAPAHAGVDGNPSTKKIWASIFFVLGAVSLLYGQVFQQGEWFIRIIFGAILLLVGLALHGYMTIQNIQSFVSTVKGVKNESSS